MPLISASSEPYHLVERFDGFVDEIDQSSGRLWLRAAKCKTDPTISDSNPIQMEMEISKLPESEVPYLTDGAYFSWEIGVVLKPGDVYRDMNDADDIRSVFRFNKEIWTEEELEDSAQHVRKMMEAIAFE